MSGKKPKETMTFETCLRNVKGNETGTSNLQLFKF